DALTHPLTRMVLTRALPNGRATAPSYLCESVFICGGFLSPAKAGSMELIINVIRWWRAVRLPPATISHAYGVKMWLLNASTRALLINAPVDPPFAPPPPTPTPPTPHTAHTDPPAPHPHEPSRRHRRAPPPPQ